MSPPGARWWAWADSAVGATLGFAGGAVVGAAVGVLLMGGC